MAAPYPTMYGCFSANVFGRSVTDGLVLMVTCRWRPSRPPNTGEEIVEDILCFRCVFCVGVWKLALKKYEMRINSLLFLNDSDRNRGGLS